MDSLAGVSAYKTIELVGTSSKGWEEAIQNAVYTTSQELANLRVTEIVELDTKLSEGRILEYRARVRLSFKVETEPETL